MHHSARKVNWLSGTLGCGAGLFVERPPTGGGAGGKGGGGKGGGAGGGAAECTKCPAGFQSPPGGTVCIKVHLPT
jgi:hypothetical protein